MYKYRIYGLNVNCSIELPLFTEQTFAKGDMAINVKYISRTIPADGTSLPLQKKGNVYFLNFFEYGYYEIYINEPRIDCYAPNYESFFSTLFNVPFSIYFLLRGELLLHTSTVILDNRLICLVGQKGSGKSTLSSVLSKCNNVTLYGDDTLRTNKNRQAFRACALLKLTEETAIILKQENCVGMNITSKGYYRILSADNHYLCEVLVTFERTDDRNIALEKIEEPIKKKILLSQNIVGSDFFDRELLMNASIYIKQNFNSFDCYKLFIPNSITELNNKKDIITALFKHQSKTKETI